MRLTPERLAEIAANCNIYAISYAQVLITEVRASWADCDRLEGRALATEEQLAAARGEAQRLAAALDLILHATPAHIDSIALRHNHGFGLLREDQKVNIRRIAKQMHEESTGQGFYPIDTGSRAALDSALAQARRDGAVEALEAASDQFERDAKVSSLRIAPYIYQECCDRLRARSAELRSTP